MKYNRLGETSLLVSELSFGTWVSFSKGGQVSEVDLAYEIMIEAYMGGVNFFDNAGINLLFYLICRGLFSRGS
eukprot:maker-scaffold_7-snap-gene-8.59-mRNA-1 protein AED:0.05 eAED:0.05 QI:235/1/1/1/0.66/0.57/7/1024/72